MYGLFFLCYRILRSHLQREVRREQKRGSMCSDLCLGTETCKWNSFLNTYQYVLLVTIKVRHCSVLKHKAMFVPLELENNDTTSITSMKTKCMFKRDNYAPSNYVPPRSDVKTEHNKWCNMILTTSILCTTFLCYWVLTVNNDIV